MSDLPASILEGMAYPFSIFRGDYFGPFHVKNFWKRLRKWICLFACFSSRAVHLENVPTLDTQSCLDAVHRFVTGRGYPETLLSDNGTNFVGAPRAIRELLAALNETQLEEHSAKLGIKWKFQPPGARPSGGIWEHLVVLFKKAMWKVFRSQSLKEKQLTKIFCSMEQLLNNRSLAAFSCCAAVLEVLTPNHFLLGRSTVDYPFLVCNGGSAALKKTLGT